MTIGIIAVILIVFAILGNMMMLRPSAKERQKMHLRDMARKLGLQVSIENIQLPFCEEKISLTSYGLIRKDKSQTIANGSSAHFWLWHFLAKSKNQLPNVFAQEDFNQNADVGQDELVHAKREELDEIQLHWGFMRPPAEWVWIGSHLQSSEHVPEAIQAWLGKELEELDFIAGWIANSQRVAVYWHENLEKRPQKETLDEAKAQLDKIQQFLQTFDQQIALYMK